MNLILLVVLLIVLFGFGGGYVGYNRGYYGYGGYGGALGLIVVRAGVVMPVRSSVAQDPACICSSGFAMHRRAGGL